MLFIVNHAELPRSHTLHRLGCVHGIGPLGGLFQHGRIVFGRMAYLESNSVEGHRLGKEVKVVYAKVLPIGRSRLETLAHVEHVLGNILLHGIPWAAAKAQSVALTYGVKPQPFVHSYLLTGLQFDHIAGIFAKVAPYVVVVIDLSKKANALRILALGIDKMLALGYLAHLILHVVPYREERFLQLPIVYLSKKVGLVFHRIGACGEPFLAVDDFGLGIVARCNEVVIVPHLLIESAELDESVAHHIGIRRETGPHLVHGVGRYLIPTLPVA